MASILIYHAGALGDFITVLPVLSALREGHPGARLVLLGRKAHGETAREAGLLDEVWDIDRAEFASLFTGRPGMRAAHRLAAFDHALAFASPLSPIVTALKAAGVDHVRAQPPLPDRACHVVDYHLSLLEGLAPYTLGAGPLLELPSRTDRGALDRWYYDHPPVVVHPGSGSARKNWPVERFAELAQRLAELGRPVVWLRGPAEQDLSLPPHASVAETPSVQDLARLLSAAALYVGNDAGVTHLAAACRCPTVVLFGPSDPTVWAPRGERVRVVDAAPPCRPCHPTPAGAVACTERCMARLNVATVLRACRECRVQSAD